MADSVIKRPTGTVAWGNNNGDTFSVANNTATAAGSIDLPSKGYWFLVATGNWASNSTGYRQIMFSSSKDPGRQDAATTRAASGSSKQTYVQISNAIYVSEPTTVNLYAYQNSGSALNVWPYMRAVYLGS